MSRWVMVRAEACGWRLTRGSEDLSRLQNNNKPAPCGFAENWSIFPPCSIAAPDNAAMESFFATMTKECTGRVRFTTRQEARTAGFEYLECFYNPVRLHSTLQYVSPVAFEHPTPFPVQKAPT